MGRLYSRWPNPRYNLWNGILCARRRHDVYVLLPTRLRCSNVPRRGKEIPKNNERSKNSAFGWRSRARPRHRPPAFRKTYTPAIHLYHKNNQPSFCTHADRQGLPILFFRGLPTARELLGRHYAGHSRKSGIKVKYLRPSDYRLCRAPKCALRASFAVFAQENLVVGRSGRKKPISVPH